VSSDDIEWCKANVKVERAVYMPSAEPTSVSLPEHYAITPPFQTARSDGGWLGSIGILIHVSFPQGLDLDLRTTI